MNNNTSIKQIKHFFKETFQFNANWIAGLNKAPFGKDWMLLGEQLCEVFYIYFSENEKK